MQNAEFDPTFDPSAVPTKDGDFDEVAARQQEEHRLQLIGDENEARGLNRDGTQKAPEQSPVVVPPAAPQANVAGAATNFQELRDIQIPDVKDAPKGGGGMTEEALLVKAKLSKEPRFPFYIPLDPGEKKGVAYRSVTINGYRSEVKKGMMVQVPRSIYNVLVDAYNAEASATDREENLNNPNPGRDSALGIAR